MDEKAEIKTFGMSISEVFESKDRAEELGLENVGIMKGFASTFGNVDLGNDIIERGAFTKTIKQSGGRLPILDHHQMAEQIGWGIEASENSKGLLVEHALDLNTRRGAEKFSLAKMAKKLDVKVGLSIGFRAIKFEFEKTEKFGMIRRLKELKLFEWSHVTFGMNPKALAQAAKAWSAELDPDGDTLEQLILNFYTHAQKQGFNSDEVKQALLIGAALDQDEPGIAHSLGGLLATLKGK